MTQRPYIEGVRVIRGRHWRAEDDTDGGEGHVGTVVASPSDGAVLVAWDMDAMSTCRAGEAGQWDLRVFDTATVGVQHVGTVCAECGEKDVWGMLWRCADCKDDCPSMHLCTACYADDKHDTRHQFLRIDFPGSEGQLMKKRKVSVRIRAMGLFPGAKVKRGRGWKWKNQDGGPGSEGELLEVKDLEGKGRRHLGKVRWATGRTNLYRLAYQGHVDVTCTEEEEGGFYYRDHLPCLDTADFSTLTSSDASLSEAETGDEERTPTETCSDDASGQTLSQENAASISHQSTSETLKESTPNHIQSGHEPAKARPELSDSTLDKAKRGQTLSDPTLDTATARPEMSDSMLDIVTVRPQLSVSTLDTASGGPELSSSKLVSTTVGTEMSSSTLDTATVRPELSDPTLDTTTVGPELSDSTLDTATIGPEAAERGTQEERNPNPSSQEKEDAGLLFSPSSSSSRDRKTDNPLAQPSTDNEHTQTQQERETTARAAAATTTAATELSSLQNPGPATSTTATATTAILSSSSSAAAATATTSATAETTATTSATATALSSVQNEGPTAQPTTAADSHDVFSDPGTDPETASPHDEELTPSAAAATSVATSTSTSTATTDSSDGSCAQSSVSETTRRLQNGGQISNTDEGASGGTGEPGGGGGGWRVGEKAAVGVPPETLKELQHGFGGTTHSMFKKIGQTGTVTRVLPTGVVGLRLDRLVFRFNPAALIKVHVFSKGDRVRVKDDLYLLRVLNERLVWTTSMDRVAGKVGEVSKVDSDGDLKVSFGQKSYLLSPSCCEPAPDSQPEELTGRVDNNASESFQGGGGLLERLMAAGGGAGSDLLSQLASSVSMSDLGQLSQLGQLGQLQQQLAGALGGIGGMGVIGGGDRSSPEGRLQKAAATGDVEKAKELCAGDKSLINKLHNGLSPLMVAAHQGKRKVALVLLEMGADVNAKGVKDATALSASLDEKHEDLAMMMLEWGADPCGVTGKQRTPLHQAVFSSLNDVAQILLTMGPPLNAQDKYGDTPLHDAISRHNVAMAELLLQLDGVDVTVINRKGYSPLHLACRIQSTQLVGLLLMKDQGTTVNHRKEQDMAPLHTCVKHSYLQGVRLLLTVGSADVNLLTGERSMTALHMACLHMHTDIVDVLVEHGANLNVSDKDGDTPLHLAIGGSDGKDKSESERKSDAEKRIRVSRMLITRGARVDTLDNKGRPPTVYGPPEVQFAVKLFIQQNPGLVASGTSRGPSSSPSPATLSPSSSLRQSLIMTSLRDVTMPCARCGGQCDVTLLPCGHKNVCSGCVLTASRCPLCQTPVERTEPIAGNSTNPVQPQASEQPSPATYRDSSDTIATQASDAAVPEASDAAVPQASDAAVPLASDAAVPEASDAAAPQESDAVASKASDAALPQTSDAAVPQAYDAALPQASDAAVPQAYDAAASKASATAVTQASNTAAQHTADTAVTQTSDTATPQASDNDVHTAALGTVADRTGEPVTSKGNETRALVKDSMEVAGDMCSLARVHASAETSDQDERSSASIDTPDQEERPAAETADQDERPSAGTTDQDKRPSLDTTDQEERPSAKTTDEDNRPSAKTADQDKRPSADTTDQDARPPAKTTDKDERPSSETSDQDEKLSAENTDQDERSSALDERPSAPRETADQDKRPSAETADDEITPEHSGSPEASTVESESHATAKGCIDARNSDANSGSVAAAEICDRDRRTATDREQLQTSSADSHGPVASHPRETSSEEVVQAATRTSGKEEDVTPTNGKQESVGSTNGKQEAVTSTSGKQEAVTSTSGKQEAVTSTSGKQEAVTSTSGKQEAVTSTSGKQETVTSARGKEEAVTSTRGKEKAMTSTIGKHEATAGSAEKNDATDYASKGARPKQRPAVVPHPNVPQSNVPQPPVPQSNVPQSPVPQQPLVQPQPRRFDPDDLDLLLPDLPSMPARGGGTGDWVVMGPGGPTNLSTRGQPPAAVASGRGGASFDPWQMMTDAQAPGTSGGVSGGARGGGGRGGGRGGGGGGGGRDAARETGRAQVSVIMDPRKGNSSRVPGRGDERDNAPPSQLWGSGRGPTKEIKGEGDRGQAVARLLGAGGASKEIKGDRNMGEAVASIWGVGGASGEIKGNRDRDQAVARMLGDGGASKEIKGNSDRDQAVASIWGDEGSLKGIKRESDRDQAVARTLGDGGAPKEIKGDRDRGEAVASIWGDSGASKEIKGDRDRGEAVASIWGDSGASKEIKGDTADRVVSDPQKHPTQSTDSHVSGPQKETETKASDIKTTITKASLSSPNASDKLIPSVSCSTGSSSHAASLSTEATASSSSERSLPVSPRPPETRPPLTPPTGLDKPPSASTATQHPGVRTDISRPHPTDKKPQTGHVKPCLQTDNLAAIFGSRPRPGYIGGRRLAAAEGKDRTLCGEGSPKAVLSGNNADMLQSASFKPFSKISDRNEKSNKLSGECSPTPVISDNAQMLFSAAKMGEAGTKEAKTQRQQHGSSSALYGEDAATPRDGRHLEDPTAVASAGTQLPQPAQLEVSETLERSSNVPLTQVSVPNRRESAGNGATDGRNPQKVTTSIEGTDYSKYSISTNKDNLQKAIYSIKGARSPAGEPSSPDQRSLREGADSTGLAGSRRDAAEERALGEGDRVVIGVTEERLVELQQAYGGTTKGMLKSAGRMGVVTERISKGAVSVRFSASLAYTFHLCESIISSIECQYLHDVFTISSFQSAGRTGVVTGRTTKGAVSVRFSASLAYRFHPRALLPAHVHRVGDTVRVRGDRALLQLLNQRLGNGQEIVQTVGKVGKVTEADEEGDVTVSFGTSSFRYSPASCVPAPGATPDAVTAAASATNVCINASSSAGSADRQDFMQKVKEGVNVSSTFGSHSININNGGSSPISRLFTAIGADNPTVVKDMCQSDPSLVERVHEARMLTPLMYASWKGHVGVMDQLVSLGADVNRPLVAPKVSRTPLSAAMEGAREEATVWLLDRGADPNLRCSLTGCTALHRVAIQNNVQFVQMLLQRGADVNTQDVSGDTPLVDALANRSHASADLLLDCDRCDVTLAGPRGISPLHMACMRSYPSAVERILLRDVSGVNQWMRGDYLPIHLAADDDCEENIRLLCLLGSADVNVQARSDKHGGDCALHMACLRGNFPCVEALLDFGAEVNIANKDLDTPLHYAMGGSSVSNGDTDMYIQEVRVRIACTLISNGAFVDAENEKGRSCMRYGRPELQAAVQSFMDENRHLVQKRGRGGPGADATLVLRGQPVQCAACQTNMSDVTLLPCGHKTACSACADKVSVCPLCQCRVDSTTTDDQKGALFEAISGAW